MARPSPLPDAAEAARFKLESARAMLERAFPDPIGPIGDAGRLITEAIYAINRHLRPPVGAADGRPTPERITET